MMIIRLGPHIRLLGKYTLPVIKNYLTFNLTSVYLKVILTKQPKSVFMTFEVSEIYADISRVPQVRVDRYFSSTYTNSTIPCTNLHFIFVLLITNEIRSNTVYNWYSR